MLFLIMCLRLISSVAIFMFTSLVKFYTFKDSSSNPKYLAVADMKASLLPMILPSNV